MSDIEVEDQEFDCPVYGRVVNVEIEYLVRPGRKARREFRCDCSDKCPVAIPIATGAGWTYDWSKCGHPQGKV